MRRLSTLALCLGAALLLATISAPAQAGNRGYLASWRMSPGIGTPHGGGGWWGPFYRSTYRGSGYGHYGHGRHGHHGGYGGYGCCGYASCGPVCATCYTPCTPINVYPVFTYPLCGTCYGAPTYGLDWYPEAVRNLPPTNVPSTAAPPLTYPPTPPGLTPQPNTPIGPKPTVPDVPSVPELKADVEPVPKSSSRQRPTSDDLIARLASVVSPESARQLRSGQIVPPGTPSPAQDSESPRLVSAANK
jgi:hypothetical protein